MRERLRRWQRSHVGPGCAKIAHVTDLDAKTLGGRIRAARVRAGLSQDDLAREVGLDRTAVNRIESGVRKVAALELSYIATALDVRMATFFEEPTPALVAHRSSQCLDTVDSRIDALLARLAEDVEFLDSLHVDELGLACADVVDQADIEPPSTNADAEALAARARELMDVSAEESIRSLSDAVTKVGLLAFSRDIGNDTADAGTIPLRRGGVSLVNSQMKVGRRRFALAHELGHHLIADDYTVDWRVADNSDRTVPLEARFDRFARALLLPAAALDRQWPEMVAATDERTAAIRLASEFRVDMATLATRLYELELADNDTKHKVLSYRTNKTDIVELNLHVPTEELAGTTVPLPFSRAVVRLVRDERISRERALQLLRGTFEEADLPPVRERRAEDIWKFVG